MGRNKTRKKNQRSGQASDDQDPDVSETEPSSSDNISASLNETVVLSNNIMDTDVEDSEQTTGDSTPADESDSGGVVGDLKADALSVSKPEISVSNCSGVDERARVDQWLDELSDQRVTQSTNENGENQSTQSPITNCPHIKNSTSMSGIRRAVKSDVNVACSAKPCSQSSQDVGAGDSCSLSSKDVNVWFCLQCGHFGCGDCNAQGGDAEVHFKTPRSDQHTIVLKIGGEFDKIWCYSCKSFIDSKTSTVKDASQYLKRNTKLKQSLQSNNKTGPGPVIALGPPPPPPQPETAAVENTQNKPANRSYIKSRNKASSYHSNFDNGSRDDWPMGLENLGNTCFMNSALQCMSRTKSLSPKLDLYGIGNTIEILVTADPPSVQVQGTVTPDTNSENASSLFVPQVSTEVGLLSENGDSNHVVPATETETGGSSPSSSEMDSLLDVASGGASSKSSPSKELTPENYKAEIETELKKCLRLKLVIPKDSMTSRLRKAFKHMTRSADVQQGNGSYGNSEFFGRGRHVFTPSDIHDSLGKNFRPGQQHDSHELLRTVVDMMKKDQIKAFRLAIMQCYGIKKTEGKNCDPNIAELLKQWDRKLYHKTFVDEVFGGELVTFQTCLTCQSVRTSHEDFLDLSLPIRVYSKNHQIPKRMIFDDEGGSNRSLEDCLNSFIEPEQLTGSNAVECEHCHRLNLEKLAAGASFEEVFPGVKPPVVSTKENRKSKPAAQVPESEIYPATTLMMEVEPTQPYSNATEDMDDLDEPAVDGIIGNTSDIEDEGNDVPPVFLLGENEDKEVVSTTDHFLSSSDMPSKENMSLSLVATQDEGFSESDSSEEKKSASISASSSRNSISEADNVTSSQRKNIETSKPIPITKCPCSRRQMVWRPPECLTVHLKRFQITSHGTSKLSDRVKFPYILNLTPFCAPQKDDTAVKDIYDEDGEVKYALYGIVEHSGSLHWGHYVAYTKVHGSNPANRNETNGSSNNTENTPDKWFYISDSSVSPSSLESVLGKDPYILFYERIRGKDKKDKLTQLQEINNPSASSIDSTVAAAAPNSTSTTSAVAGCSFDFDYSSSTSFNYSLD